MSGTQPIQAVLNEIHRESGADQSALYYLAYPKSDSLILCTTAGGNNPAERYWRSHCSDAETLRRLRTESAPFSFSGQSVLGGKEATTAVPISTGVNVIGAVVFCYQSGKAEASPNISESVAHRANELFDGWVDFLVAEQSRPLSVLFHIAGTISASLDLEQVLVSVVEQATFLFRAKMSSLMLVNAEKRELELITAYGSSMEYLNKPNLPIDGSILGRVVKENTVLQVENLFEEPLYLHKEMAAREGVCSLLAAPISFQKNVLGVLNIYSAFPRGWQSSERELLQTFAHHAAVAITNARVHEQVLTMEEQLQVSAKLSSLGELAAGLAHEIRNPLAVINMLLHSWKSSQPDREEFERDLAVVEQKISDLNTLVTDLLNLAKPRALEKKPHDLEEIIDRLLRLLRHRSNQQRVSIKKNIRIGNKVIELDRERMEQAILNLLLNALDVTPENGTISIGLRKEDQWLAIDVADSGPGIPEARLPDLFKAFRSTKQKGAGLGLPMTKRIVEEHRGEIQITRNGAKGATFTIRLPRE